jgi:hypothetical protein
VLFAQQLVRADRMAMFFEPEPIPSSAASLGQHGRHAGAAVRQSAEEAPRAFQPQPQPQPYSAAADFGDHRNELGGSSMSEYALDDEDPSSRSQSGRGARGAGAQARERRSRNYGSSVRIGALLEHGSTAASAPLPASLGGASSSVLSRPSLNSSFCRQQRIWGAAAASRVPDTEVEKRVREEMKRIEAAGREQVEQGRTDTVEASLALEESRIREGPAPDESVFRGLVPIASDVKQVLHAKVVKKQIDAKWQSQLALKPSIGLFAGEAPDREVRSFSLPALPQLAHSSCMATLSAPCGPMLATSYAQHLDFQWHDLRELPDGVLDVDRV